MPEVRNALTKALADGLYLRLDTTNDPLTGNLQTLHIGINQAPTATHLLIGSETYTGSGTRVGFGCFPQFNPTALASNIVVSLQGNVWFGSTNWAAGSGVRALDFYPAPNASGIGSVVLDITGVNTGGMLNIIGRTVTANTITGIVVVPIANIFGGTDNTTANIIRGIYVVSATSTTGTWGRLTGLEIEPQTSGVLNQGLWLSGDGVGADLVFGAGGDVNMYYDGTDFYLITDLVAASDFLVDCGTQKTIELVETVWDDLRIVPGAFSFLGAADPTLSAWQPGGSGTTFRVYKFQKNDEVFASCQMPHKYKEGADLEFHIHWTPCDRGNEESGNYVGWKIDYTVANLDGTFGSSSTVDLSDACSGTDDYHEISSSVTVSGTGLTISHILMLRIYRSDTGADDTWIGTTATQSPALLEFDIHFEIDTIGSRQERVK